MNKISTMAAISRGVKPVGGGAGFGVGEGVNEGDADALGVGVGANGVGEVDGVGDADADGQMTGGPCTRELSSCTIHSSRYCTDVKNPCRMLHGLSSDCEAMPSTYQRPSWAY